MFESEHYPGYFAAGCYFGKGHERLSGICGYEELNFIKSVRSDFIAPLYINFKFRIGKLEICEFALHGALQTGGYDVSDLAYMRCLFLKSAEFLVCDA